MFSWFNNLIDRLVGLCLCLNQMFGECQNYGSDQRSEPTMVIEAIRNEIIDN